MSMGSRLRWFEALQVLPPESPQARLIRAAGAMLNHPENSILRADLGHALDAAVDEVLTAHPIGSAVVDRA